MGSKKDGAFLVLIRMLADNFSVFLSTKIIQNRAWTYRVWNSPHLARPISCRSLVIEKCNESSIHANKSFVREKAVLKSLVAASFAARVVSTRVGMYAAHNPFTFRTARLRLRSW